MIDKKTARPRGTDSARVIQVIVTESTVGSGIIAEDPVRAIRQYWSLDGELLVTIDPVSQSTAHLQ